MRRLWVVLSLALAGSSGEVVAASFTPLVGVNVTGVSGDGSVVVGHSGDQAVRWTASGGATPIGSLGEEAGRLVGVAGVSADGSAVAGTFLGMGSGGYCRGPYHAFRWTAGTGMVDLVTDPAEPRCFVSEGISPDATTVFMWAHQNEENAYQWTEAGGLAPLGQFVVWPGAIPNAASYDGSVVVGSATEGPGPTLAVRWLGGSMLPLGVEGIAYEVSWDGSIVFGSGPDGVFRWTEAAGALPVGFSGTPAGVTSDGSVLVTGSSLWDAINGVRTLQSELTVAYGLGAALAGWDLGEVTGISADGRAIIGNGTNPLGQPSGWIAIIPEPSTLPLLGAALGGLAALARLRGRFE